MKIFNSFRDRLRLFFYKRIYDFSNNNNPHDFKLSDTKCIVISKIDGKLGDTQVITSFINSIQTAFPSIKIVVLSSRNLETTYKNCLNIDDYIALTKRPSLHELDRTVKQIKNADLFITLESKFRLHDFYLLNRLRPKFIAGINSDVSCININLANRNPNSHITRYFEDLLTLGGCRYITRSYVPLTTQDALTTAKSYCRKEQIALAPWGASKHKHLSDETIIKIVQQIIDKTQSPIALLVPPEGNYLKKKLKNRFDNKFLIDIPDYIDVNELASIVSMSKAMISVDTATVHLACASKIPLFAIYNGNDQELITLWSPLPSDKKDSSIFFIKNKLIDELSHHDLMSALEKFLLFTTNNGIL